MTRHDDPEPADDASRQVLDAIRRIVRVLREGSRLAEKQVGLSGAQLFVLLKLSATPSLSVRELAARTLTHQSSVSVVVSKLVERGLVARRASSLDGRRVELTVTEQGRALLAAAPGAAQERLMGAVERLPADTRRRLAGALAAVVAEMGIDEGAPPMSFEPAETGRGRGPGDGSDER